MLKEICLFFSSPKNISNSEGHEFDEIQWFCKEGKKQLLSILKDISPVSIAQI